MTYQIEYDYQTGDSFHTSEETRVLEYEWEDIEMAKEALQRIKEHYKWYHYKDKMEGRFPKRFIDEEDIAEKPKWHNVNSKGLGSDHYYCLLNIRMDNGVDVQFWPPWCGYFEQLYGARIINKKEEEEGDLSFTL